MRHERLRDEAVLLACASESWQNVYPRQESNLRTWFRKPLLYPLSYGGLPV